MAKVSTHSQADVVIREDDASITVQCKGSASSLQTGYIITKDVLKPPSNWISRIKSALTRKEAVPATTSRLQTNLWENGKSVEKDSMQGMRLRKEFHFDDGFEGFAGSGVEAIRLSP